MIKKIILLVITLISDNIYALIINKEEPVHYFINHEEQISDLREKLIRSGVVGVTGITGMGKSEMARKYIQEYQHDYDIIAFLDVSVDLIPQFIAVAKEINQQICLKEKCHIMEDSTVVKRSLMEYLKQKRKWLLVFDNLHINENEKIKDIIDWQHNGHIIICSQDAKYLQQKVSVPHLSDEHASSIIQKIMKDPPLEFVQELVQTLRGYPPYMIGHSATYLYNNSHMTIKQYMDYMKRNENKIRAHLNIILSQMHQQGKDILYKVALLNNQRVPREIVEQLVDDKIIMSDSIDEIIRFGLIEQISKDRNNQMFRMHDVVKEELLNIAGNKSNQKNVNLLLDKINNIIPESVNDRLTVMISNRFLESNLEVLLNNAEKYNANIYKIMELRKKLLWYYLRGQHQPYNAKKMVDWFKSKEPNISLWFCNDKKKAVYSGYLAFIVVYECSIMNQKLDVVMRYLSQAEKIAKKLYGYDELKSYIYSIKALIQITVGDIVNAKKNIQKAEKAYPTTPKTFLGTGFIEYNKAKVFLAEGEYQKALSMLLVDIDKFKLFHQKGKVLLSEYIIQARILSYMKRFKEAYDIINNNVYKHIKGKKREEVSTIILVRTLTELSRAELGLGKIEDALNHATETMNILIEDKNRNNKSINLDNSTDILLARALVVKADILAAIGKTVEAIKTYKIVKNIYENIYGIENMKNMDNVSYLFVQAAKAASKLPREEDRQIWCSYFYKLFIQSFGRNHFRYQEIKQLF